MIFVSCNDSLVFFGGKQYLSVVFYPMHAKLYPFDLLTCPYSPDGIDIHLCDRNHQLLAAMYRWTQTVILFAQGKNIERNWRSRPIKLQVEIDGP